MADDIRMRSGPAPLGTAEPAGAPEGGAPFPGRDRVLRRPQLLKLLGIGKTLLYDLIEDENFPEPKALGKRSVGWLESEVLAWVQERPSPSELRQKNSRPRRSAA